MRSLLSGLAFALALAVIAMEILRPLNCTAAMVSSIAFVSICFSAGLWLFSKPKTSFGFFILFLPAILLAVSIQVFYAGDSGAAALSVTAFAFELRRCLLRFAAKCELERLALAQKLEDRIPERVQVFVDHDIESEVPVKSVHPGHLVRLAPGQTVPVDGTVTFGSSFVNESLEDSDDVQIKGMGTFVLAGTENRNSSLLFRASAVGEFTFLQRMAKQIRSGHNLGIEVFYLIDLAVILFSMIAFSISGPIAALRVYLVLGAANYLAASACFEVGIAKAAIRFRWLWSRDGIRRIAKTGILAFRAPGVIREGRPRLNGISTRQISEDAALSLMGPLARKIESPAAFALLLELRKRNIPLEMGEFFQPRAGGGSALVSGMEVQWLDLHSIASDPMLPPEMETFVREQASEGNDIYFLKRGEEIVAAIAFTDTPIANAAMGAQQLQADGTPLLLVSELPRSAAEHLRANFNFEHLLPGAGNPEVETLAQKLTEQKLSPTWIQTDAFRPSSANAIISSAEFCADSDLSSLRTDLSTIARAIAFAKASLVRLRSALACSAGLQLGLLFSAVSADREVAQIFHLGAGWPMNNFTLAFLSCLGGLFSIFLARPARSLASPN